MIDNILIDEYTKISKMIVKVQDIKNKSVLITGANGLIGSYIVNYLNYLNKEFDFNITIYAMSRSMCKLEKLFGAYSRVEFVEQDLNETLKFNKDVDFIIHTASNAHPIAFSQDPVGTMKTNLFGTMNLLEFAKENNAKFLYISTGEIYGNNIDNKAFTENYSGVIDTKAVRSCYPESKRAAETLCMAYNSQYGVKTNIVRLCYVYGANITETNSRADAQFLRNALNHEDIVMKSEGLQRRTYCYVADAVSAIFFVLLNGKNSEFYNVSNPDSIVTVREYAQILADISGVKLVFELPDDIEKRGYSKSADSILDSTKLQNLGWKPLYGIKDGLTHSYKIKEESFTKC